MIEKTMNEDAATELFYCNSAFLGTKDVVPDYRVYELFGTQAINYFTNRAAKKSFKERVDYEFITGIDGRRIALFTLSGFLEFVSYNNFTIITEERDTARTASDAEKQEAAQWAEQYSCRIPFTG